MSSNGDIHIPISIEQLMANVDNSGLDVASMYATIAIAKMMYLEYQEKQNLKNKVKRYMTVGL